MAKLAKGDIVKPKAGGHAMTVVKISKDGKVVTAAYNTPNGQRHDLTFKVQDLQRVVL